MADVPDDLRTAAVVVAHDRRELLEVSLSALAAQTRALDAVVVVDNASSDGSGPAALALAAAAGLPLDLVTLPRNTGGAGGFAAGMARALVHACPPHGPSLLWLLDDDTVPSPTALAELLAARERWIAAGADAGSRSGGEAGPRSGGDDAPVAPALLASRVVWTDGREHPMNTPRRKPLVRPAESARAAAAGGVPVRSASFVSVLLDAAAVREAGLPMAAFFLWNDDFELTTRVLRERAGLHVGASLVEHRTRTFGASDADPGARFRFEVRNKLWTFTRSTSLSPREKALYGASTLRRWARTLAGSGDRRLLVRSALTGALEGLRAPRPTSDVLSGLGPVSDDVARVEAAAHQHGAGRGVPRGQGPAAASAAPVADVAPSTTGEPFSLLLPVYGGDRPGFLRAAFTSATTGQTRPPAEVVLVRDGPLPPALAQEVERLVGASSVPVVEVTLETNVGLALALEAGLTAGNHDLVARMDADDIALPQRFAVQVPLLEAGADLVGSALEELVGDDLGGQAARGAVRRQPPDAAWIASRARFHSPFNHPTVVYRRSAVAAAGGYRTLPLLEDYWLFARMIAAGAVCANVPDVLLRYRVSAGSYQRRGGWRLLRSELTLQRHLLAEGFVTPAQYARNVVVRAGYRAVPVSLRRLAYRAVFTARNPAG